MKRALSVLALVCVAGCGEDLVLTDVSTELPEGDTAAATELRRMRVEVWPASTEACRRLVGWRVAVCGRDCDVATVPTGELDAPEASATLERSSGGGWPAAEIRASGGGPWDVVITGLDDAGSPFLYGCRTVASSEPTVIPLWRPWCDVSACAGQYHPACPVELDCAVDPSDDDHLGPPRCRPLAPIVWSWEQDGDGCEPTAEAHFAPCRPARVVCERGRTAPEADGVCPAAGATECGAGLEEDRDCDGRFPGPCGSCSPGDLVECGPSGACSGTAACEADGTWGECVVLMEATESCGGGDEDCDGIEDDADPDALADCNVGRPTDTPAADQCTGGACRCGGGSPCGADGACCGGACVSHLSDPDHCGGCGNECAAGATCVDGRCRPMPDGGVCVPGTEECDGLDTDCDEVEDGSDPDALAHCNDGRATDRPRADACAGTGGCTCGGGAACSDSFRACCGATCVDTRSDIDHCGLCGNACGAGDLCAAGSCCDPQPEVCDGVDQDCDTLGDGDDPDALADCNDGRPAGRPRADACVPGGGSCRCGGSDPCDGDLGCCGGACVDTDTSDEHCGECGNVCVGLTTCVLGACVD